MSVSSQPNGEDYVKCGTLKKMKNVARKTVECPDGTMGRYVRVWKSKGVLTLCEVEVHDGLPLGKFHSQSDRG